MREITQKWIRTMSEYKELLSNDYNTVIGSRFVVRKEISHAGELCHHLQMLTGFRLQGQDHHIVIGRIMRHYVYGD
jgi:hypothetical protein